MKRNLLLDFIKDRMIYIAGYAAGMLLLIIYFILTAEVGDIIYPFSLSLFVLLIVLVFDWIKYYRFYYNLRRNLEDEYYELEPASNEQREVSEAVIALQDKYSQEISRMNMELANKQHFLSQWIHNMKTPVSVIGLILQKIKLEELLREDILRDIEEENGKIYNGLEQVLNIIRMEEFFRDYEPEAVDLAENLKEVINLRKSQFIYSNVFPKIKYEEKQFMVITDSKWNKFMLEQTISNAIKYSSEIDKRKQVTFNISRDKYNTVLEIIDEGVGIPPHDIKKVFEPFFTGDNGRIFKNSTGIGLYISRLISEKLGHKIEISSEAGIGTKVSITYVTKV